MRADELSSSHSFVAYHLRMFGVELSMKMKGRDAGPFLLAQMELLEQEKGKVKPPMHQPPPYPDPNWTPPTPALPAPPPPAPTAEAAADTADATPEAKDPAGQGKEQTANGGGDGSQGSDGGGSAAGTEKSAAEMSVRAAEEAISGMTVAEQLAVPQPPMITPPKVPMSAQQALRSLALDLYERGRLADRPDVYPSPSTAFGVTEAPKICRCLHAAAVLLDAIKRFEPKLPADLERFQVKLGPLLPSYHSRPSLAWLSPSHPPHKLREIRLQLAAHARSTKLGGQINSAFKFREDEPIPLRWRPADMAAASPLPPNPAPPPVAPSAFPSVPKG